MIKKTIYFLLLLLSFSSTLLFADNNKKELKIDESFSKNLFDEIRKDVDKQSIAKSKIQRETLADLKKNSIKNIEATFEQLNFKK